MTIESEDAYERFPDGRLRGEAFADAVQAAYDELGEEERVAVDVARANVEEAIRGFTRETRKREVRGLGPTTLNQVLAGLGRLLERYDYPHVEEDEQPSLPAESSETGG